MTGAAQLLGRPEVGCERKSLIPLLFSHGFSPCLYQASCAYSCFWERCGSCLPFRSDILKLQRIRSRRKDQVAACARNQMGGHHAHKNRHIAVVRGAITGSGPEPAVVKERDRREGRNRWQIFRRYLDEQHPRRPHECGGDGVFWRTADLSGERFADLSPRARSWAARRKIRPF